MMFQEVHGSATRRVREELALVQLFEITGYARPASLEILDRTDSGRACAVERLSLRTTTTREGPLLIFLLSLPLATTNTMDFSPPHPALRRVQPLHDLAQSSRVHNSLDDRQSATAASGSSSSSLAPSPSISSSLHSSTRSTTSSSSHRTNRHCRRSPPSLDSTSSLSSRGSSSRESHGTASSYTSYNSDLDDSSDGEDADDCSVLDDLYATSWSHPSLASPPPRAAHASSPPPPPSSVELLPQQHSPALLNDSDHAPIMPLFASFAALLSSSSSTPSTSTNTLDMCFCGSPSEDDSIYCSRVCAQADALSALCGSQDASSKSTSRKSTSSASHYRRVERDEAAREKERTKAKERAAKDRVARTGAWRSNLSPSSAAASKTSTRPLPPRTSSRAARSSNGTVPSLSSSVASSSTCSSPLTPSFPTTPTHDSPLVPASKMYLHPSTTVSKPDNLLFSSSSTEDLYSSYLNATPTLASTRAAALSDAEYGIAPAPPQPKAGASYLGMMMLQTDDEEEAEEERDRVASMRFQAPPTVAPAGHARKLSFDDVLGIFNQ